MDKISFLYYLRKVLPEIDVHDVEIQNVLQSNLEDEQKVLKIVSNYFKKKRAHYAHASHNNVLSLEAKQINKLFPSVKFNYIFEQLEIFKDMPNRWEIVLRMIIHSKIPITDPDLSQASGVKRANPNVQFLDNVNNNHSIKIRKLSDLTAPTNVTVQYQPIQKVHPFPSSEKPSNHILAPATFTVASQNSVMLSNPLTSNHFTRYNLPEIYRASSAVIKPATFTVAPQNNVQNNPPVLNTEPQPARNSTNEYYIRSTSFQLPKASNCTVSSTDAINREIPEIPSLKHENADETTKAELDFVSQMLLPFKEPDQTVDQKPLITSKPEIHSSDDTPLSLVKPKEEVGTTSKNNSQDSEETVVYSPEVQLFENMSEEKNFAKGPLNLSLDVSEGNLPEQVKYEGIWDRDAEMQQVLEEALNLEGQEEDLAMQNARLDVAGYVTPKKERAQSPVVEHNLPSTSKQQSEEAETMNLGNEPFNLTDYLHEITNISKTCIRKRCRKLNVIWDTKPDPPTLNFLVDKLLTDDVDSSDASEASDVEDKLDHFFTRLLKEVEENTKPNPPSKLLHHHVRVRHGPAPKRSHHRNKSSNIQQESIFLIPNEKENPEIQTTVDVPNEKINTQLVNQLCSIFPDACPNFIKGLCKGKAVDNLVLDSLITHVLDLNNQYPKREIPTPEPEVVPENQLEILKEFLPDADPDYLRMMCDKFEGKAEKVKSFLNNAMERRDYPTMKDYLRRQQLSAQQKQYTTEFNVENFIKVIPDPHAFFSDPSRTLKLDAAAAHYALVFLRNTFNKLSIRTIQSVFTKSGCSLSKSVKELNQAMTQSCLVMRSVRRPIEMPNNLQNIPLLQEIAYFSHQNEINEYLKRRKETEETERESAKNLGLMKSCGCCYDEEVLPKDIYSCENGCEFCKSCVVKSSEVRFGEGKLDFPCLMNCDAAFSLQTLQSVLSPKLFSRVAQKKALEEIKSAGIDELEMCPFCDFATIPADGYNIFTCMNPECMKESCRMCKEPSHIPLRCDEIEKDEDVKARTFVENKMTEALLKKCYKCGVKFFKEEGCNKMTCSCGAQMCYVCGKPVHSYKHFNGQGGDRFDLCPLYSDTNVLNKDNVLRGAEAAKAEIGNVSLKHDPTKDVQQHYEKKRPMYPQPNDLFVGQQVAEALARRLPQIFQHRHHYPL